uniref:uncharacterized protein n=1 Tax=Myxine glutinosa TaxID=7769 RepID=UPI00358E4E40
MITITYSYTFSLRAKTPWENGILLEQFNSNSGTAPAHTNIPQDTGPAIRVLRPYLQTNNMPLKDKDMQLARHLIQQLKEQQHLFTYVKDRYTRIEKWYADKRATAQPPPDVQLLKEYMRYMCGTFANAKKRENTNTTIAHVRLFLRHMAGKQDIGTSMLFLQETTKMRSWFDTLRSSGKKPSTIKNHLSSLSSFMKFLKAAQFPRVKLTSQNFDHIVFMISAFQREMNLHVRVQHQQRLEDARDKLISKHDLRTIVQKSTMKIPQLLDQIKSNPKKPARNIVRIIGLLCARLLIKNGHRKGVMTNMTLDNFRNATRKGPSRFIHVPEHKTAAHFGRATVTLSSQDHKFMCIFANIRQNLPGFRDQKQQTFFFNSRGNPCKNMSNLLRAASQTLGMKTTLTAGAIRTSIATHVTSNINENKAKNVAHHMCHSRATQQRHYIVHDDDEHLTACSTIQQQLRL